MLPMPQTFVHTVEKSRRWVDELAMELHVADPDRALHALRAGLHAIRDWLPDREVVALGAQLPMLIRGIYYEGWRLGTRQHGRDRDAIYAAIRRELAHDPLTATATNVLTAVIHLLFRHVSNGEIDHIIHVLPKPIAELWLAAMD